MEIGERTEKAKGALRKAMIPSAASVVGAGAGLLLTKQSSKLRAALPSLDDLGVRDIADDLRGRLDDVLGNGTESTPPRGTSRTSRQALDPKELAGRRQQREERRNARRDSVRA